MKKILITYYSESGSTKEIAEIIGKHITYDNIDILPVTEVDNLNYDAVILGSPNWYGKPTPKVIQFIKKYEKELGQLPIAFFFSCMDCYQTEKVKDLDMKVFCDNHFNHQIANSKKLSSWEKSHTVTTYLNNLHNISNQLNIKSLAFFKGRLNFQKISFRNALVMRFISLINKKIKQGNYIEEQDVITWSKTLTFYNL